MTRMWWIVALLAPLMAMGPLLPVSPNATDRQQQQTSFRLAVLLDQQIHLSQLTGPAVSRQLVRASICSLSLLDLLHTQGKDVDPSH